MLIERMNPQELKERTKEFALRIMRLVEALPRSAKGMALAGQLVRSGMSIAANYRSACRARSRAEFISKMGVVEEETDESALWLELIIAGKILPEKNIVPLVIEANELVAIMAASYISAGRNRRAVPANSRSSISNQKSEIKNANPNSSSIINSNRYEQRINSSYTP
jgi:four helix bundle protein